MTTLQQLEAEAGTVRNLRERAKRNEKKRDDAIEASRDVFRKRTVGLDQKHPHYKLEQRAHERRIQQIRRKFA